MCSAPKVKKPTVYQAQKEPVRYETEENRRGRQGTILTGGGGVSEMQVNGKKTALGQ